MTKFIFYWSGVSHWIHLSNISSRNTRQIVPSFPASCKILTRWNSQCTLFEWVIYIEESFFPVEGGVSASPPTNSKCIFRVGTCWDWFETRRNSATFVNQEPIEISLNLILLITVNLYHLEKKEKIFVKLCTISLITATMTESHGSTVSK